MRFRLLLSAPTRTWEPCPAGLQCRRSPDLSFRPCRRPPMSRTLSFVLLFLAFSVRAAEPEKEPPLIVKPDAFETLVNPNCSHCKDEAKRRADELRADDRVLCW